MTKITVAKIEAHSKATTMTADAKNIVALNLNGNRKNWEVYGTYYKERKVNGARGTKFYNSVKMVGWHKVTKAEVTDVLETYGLTVAEFVAIENGDYEVVDANQTSFDLEIETSQAAAVKTLETETAKTSDKVVFFENLKESHGGKIFIGDVLGAWNLATCKLGKLEKNVAKTTNAGYAILENSVGDWVSVLNNRFEVNLATGQTFNIWTDSVAIENAKNYAWDEVEEDISCAKNAGEKTFWLNVCKAKFVDSLIKFGVEDLIAAEIIREEESIACIDDYIVDVDAAAEVEEVNAKEVKISNDNTSFEVFKARAGFIRNVFDKVKGKFSIKLARPDEEANWRNDEDGWYTTKLTSKNVEDNDLYWLETNGKFRLLVMNSLSDRTLAEYDTEEEVKKAIIAIAAAVKRGDKIFAVPAPRKPIIDWDATFEEMRLEEIFTLQKNFKKYLKLGEMKLAETVFETLKTLYRQRRKKTA